MKIYYFQFKSLTQLKLLRKLSYAEVLLSHSGILDNTFARIIFLPTPEYPELGRRWWYMWCQVFRMLTVYEPYIQPIRYDIFTKNGNMPTTPLFPISPILPAVWILSECTECTVLAILKVKKIRQ